MKSLDSRKEKDSLGELQRPGFGTIWRANTARRGKFPHQRAAALACIHLVHCGCQTLGGACEFRIGFIQRPRSGRQTLHCKTTGSVDCPGGGGGNGWQMG